MQIKTITPPPQNIIRLKKYELTGFFWGMRCPWCQQAWEEALPEQGSVLGLMQLKEVLELFLLFVPQSINSSYFLLLSSHTGASSLCGIRAPESRAGKSCRASLAQVLPPPREQLTWGKQRREPLERVWDWHWPRAAILHCPAICTDVNFASKIWLLN